jgi:hypothetical protein
MSAHQIHRMLGVTYKTAWFMCHRIREAMKDDGSPLGGPGKVVESDEAFVGGSKEEAPVGKVAPMKKVMTLVERDGRARSFFVASLHHNNLRGALVTNVHRSSTLMTDDARTYWSIGREFAGHGTDGKPILVRQRPAHARLAPVTGRGGIVFVPRVRRLHGGGCFVKYIIARNSPSLECAA